MNLTDIYNELVEDTEGQEGIEKTAEEQTAEEQTPEELEKVAEEWVSAGRLMAIGYIDEMEKNAAKVGELWQRLLSATKAGAGKAGEAGEKVWKWHKKGAEELKKGITGLERAGRGGGKVGLSKTERAKLLGLGMARFMPATAGVAGAGTYMLAKGKKKK